MKTTQPLKYTLVATTTALLMLSMTVFAAPFTPGQTLDPGCAPGSADCYVSAPSGGADTDWTQNGAGIWNTDDNIGIGTNAPASQLTILDNGLAGSPSVSSVSFTGSGLNDLTTNGVYTGSSTKSIRVEIASTGTPDEIEFFVNGASQGIFPIPGLTIPIGDGTEILLGSDTGHTLGNSWEFSQLAPGGIFDILGTGNENLWSVSSSGLNSQYGSAGFSVSTPGSSNTSPTLNVGDNGDINIIATGTGLATGDDGSSIYLTTNANNGGDGWNGNDRSGEIMLTSQNDSGDAYNQWFTKTIDGSTHLEIGSQRWDAGYTNTVSASYIDMLEMDPLDPTKQIGYKFAIGFINPSHFGDNSLTGAVTVSDDYILNLGSSIANDGAQSIWVSLPNIVDYTTLSALTPDLEIAGNDLSQTTDHSALAYDIDGKNLFFFTDAGDGGTAAWEPVSPFERGVGETHLFDSNDLVGIGTTATTDKLEVLGDVRVGTSGVNGCLKDFSGGTITGTCSSDERLKTNIKPVKNVLSKISQIPLVTYTWNKKAEKKGFTTDVEQLGVLAQDVEAVFPEFVTKDEDGFKQVNYSRLSLMSLAAIQELEERISELESRIQELENSK